MESLPVIISIQLVVSGAQNGEREGECEKGSLPRPWGWVLPFASGQALREGGAWDRGGAWMGGGTWYGAV